MSGIKRYAWNGDSARSGELVLHSDHEAEVARLRAEVEAYRKDAERYRWLRNADNYPNQIGGFWNCLGETSEPEEMDEAIDAAMGEGK